MLFVGVMSGTSCDGVDVALVDFSSDIQVLATEFVPFPQDVKQLLLKLIKSQAINMQQLSRLDAELGHLYAEAVNQLLANGHVLFSDIQAIGLHGQTVYHEPNHHFGNTLQIGSATLTAKLTGIKTIANFRQSDVAHGGQGAPLAPILHQHLFAEPGKQILVINLGGIANVSSINGDAVIGFDTGPASCLMDEWTQLHCAEPYDESGQWARQGKVNHALLSDLMTEAYFRLPHPKSTGRELFNMSWLEGFLKSHFDLAVNIQRTLLQLTVESVVVGVQGLKQTIDEVIVCGGGVHNTFLMELLSIALEMPVKSSKYFGLEPDFVEATLMAWMAWQNTQQNTLDLSRITGASRPLLYGVLYQP